MVNESFGGVVAAVACARGGSTAASFGVSGGRCIKPPRAPRGEGHPGLCTGLSGTSPSTKAQAASEFSHDCFSKLKCAGEGSPSTVDPNG